MSDTENFKTIDEYVINYVLKFRIEKKLTQEDLGNIIDVTQEYIANIENSESRAKYNLSHINKIADHFNISPKEFLPINAITEK